MCLLFGIIAVHSQNTLSHFIPSLLLAKTHKLSYELELGQRWCFTFTEMQNYSFWFVQSSLSGKCQLYQASVAEQYKGRTGALPLLLAAHIRLRSPERKEKTNRAPFPGAIKQSFVKSDGQWSIGSKVPPAGPWRWIGGGENRPCLQQGLTKPGQNQAASPGNPKGWENRHKPEFLMAGSRED